jgi:hypothetical protein
MRATDLDRHAVTEDIVGERREVDAEVTLAIDAARTTFLVIAERDVGVRHDAEDNIFDVGQLLDDGVTAPWLRVPFDHDAFSELLGDLANAIDDCMILGELRVHELAVGVLGTVNLQ